MNFKNVLRNFQNNIKKISKNIKKFHKRIKWISSNFVKILNNLSILIVNKVNDCDLKNNWWRFKQILKILLKIWKVFKQILKVFKKILINNLEKFNENLNFFLLSIFIAGWGVAVPHPLQIFRVSGEGEGNVHPVPPLATPLI